MNRERLAWSGDIGTKNCLMRYLSDGALLDDSINRVMAIPDEVIRNAVMQACSYGLSKRLSQKVFVFLKKRRSRIRKIMNANRRYFPGITQWGLGV